MKRILLAVIICIAASATAAAQFAFGPRVGVNVHKMHFNKDVLNNDNRAGFVGGLEMEFTAPIIGIGFDLSVLYVHQVNSTADLGNGNMDNFKKKDFIEIPLNLKYKLGLPLVSKIVKPFVTTGPSVAFLTSRRAITEAYKNKAVDYSWNFGLGVELFNHLQVGAQYGIGLNNVVEHLGADNATKIDGKNRTWTITAAYLF